MVQSFIEKKGFRLTENSFSECLIDVGKVPKTVDILKMYPDWARWAEFKNYKWKWRNEHITNSMVIRYVVAMYDPKSIFHGLGYEDRKMASAEYAGFEISDTGLFTEYAQEIMQGQSKPANAMILCYCMNAYGAEYATYRIFERKYYEETLMDKKIDISTADKALKLLNTYRDKILAYDATIGIVKEFYRVVTNAELEIRRYTPEAKAEEWLLELTKDDGQKAK